jgi:hypothetical protein
MDDKLNILFLEMMNILCVDPTDNPKTMQKDQTMRSNYIIYSAIHHLIKIYDMIENKKMDIDYHIFITQGEEDIGKEILYLIHKYMENQGDEQYIKNVKCARISLF